MILRKIMDKLHVHNMEMVTYIHFSTEYISFPKVMFLRKI